MCGVRLHFLDEGELDITSFDELISVYKSFTQVERLFSEVLILSQFERVNFLCSVSCLKQTYCENINNVNDKCFKITYITTVI